MSMIPLPFTTVPISQNQLRRMHHMAEASLKKTTKGLAVAAILRARTGRLETAEVVLHYRPGTRRRFDADGLAPTLKVCMDALVHAGILTDDSWAQVPFCGIRVHPPMLGAPASMWLTLTDPEA